MPDTRDGCTACAEDEDVTPPDADPTSPAGRTYVTTPGGALLFPSLCAATEAG
ncbi:MULTISPECIES: hypothetical protein [unclassified Mycobacterium]|uniref:hypothetical protein n=1 Tax=unclassified Mycobacterium TaxID=2642494 RepID=UPI000AF6F858|nr:MULTISPECIES: hypothetical protein [unclassified Mycobacterium]